MIIISADSTCDLSQQLIEELDIAIIPLSVIVNEEIYKDGVDIAPRQTCFVSLRKGNSATPGLSTFLNTKSIFGN